MKVPTTYTLYQWSGESTSGPIIAYLYDDFFYIEDWSMGPLCEEVWGRDDHELDVGVDEVGAKAILLNNGIEPGEKPLTTLFEFVREKYCGCDSAATLFRELAEKVIQLTGSKSRLIFEPLPSDDPTQRQPDITLAKKILGWEPHVPLEEGLLQTIDYFRQLLARKTED